MPSFFEQLRGRRVIRSAIVYLVAAWLTMQVADVMFPALGLPGWTVTLVAALLIIGFPVSMLLAWTFNLTSKGIVRDDAYDRRIEDGVESQPDSASQGASAPPAKAVSQRSIAVLPFIDLSEHRDQGYFSDGLTDELLNVLANVEQLRVSSRTSCFFFKGKDIDVPTAASRLGVAHILEGSVRRAGNRVRITAQLIEVGTDTHLWSRSYDREVDDIFAIQDSIAQEIVLALKVRLNPEDRPDPTTESAEAYDYYLRGRANFAKFGSKSVNLAIDQFRTATDIDPKYARAWSGLADASACRAHYYGGGQPDIEQADTASRKAVQLAPLLAEAHTSRGLSLTMSKQFEAAVKEFDKAAHLEPNHFEAYYEYGRAAFIQGDMSLALRQLLKAAAVNPEDYQSPLLAGDILMQQGDTETAMKWYRHGAEAAEKYVAAQPDHARAFYFGAGAWHRLGEEKKAALWAKKAIDIDPDDSATRYNVACYYTDAGEYELALDCLEQSLTSREWLENDPELEPLRDHPRFIALVKRLG